jgi:hypothetical protein
MAADDAGHINHRRGLRRRPGVRVGVAAGLRKNFFLGAKNAGVFYARVI